MKCEIVMTTLTAKQIAHRVRQQTKIIQRHKDNIKELQKICKHENVIVEHRYDNGNYCKADDIYWDQFNCPDCQKMWVVYK
jgi:hypothetical protein